MDKIFLILLNRKPTSQEIIFFKNKEINIIKNYIKNTSEFKNFYDLNSDKIYNIFLEVLERDSIDLNIPIFMKTFVNLNYNELKMKEFVLSTVTHIRNQYKLFYKQYLGLEEEISDEEILKIINDNYTIKNFITTSSKFLILCGKKIDELTS